MRHLAVPTLVLVLIACGRDSTSPADVATVTVDAPGSTVQVGQTASFTATARDAGGKTLSGIGFSWNSSSPTTATVNASGAVTGVSTGFALISASVGAVSGNASVTVTSASDGIVSMPGFSFAPVLVSIKPGGTVRFDFPSEPHNVIFIQKAGVPADIPTMRNVSIVRQFNTAGTFAYECRLHPGMDGTIEVR
jgi:plastocyanin